MSRALDIMKELGIREEKVCLFDLPMSKDRSKAIEAYDGVREKAARCFDEGRSVCIVAEGDIGIYSSVHYVYERLQEEGYPVLHIPGIPSFVAANALAGLHLVSGEERLQVVPGNPKPGELERAVFDGYSIVVMKLSQCREEVVDFMKMYPNLGYHYFENVGTDEQKYTSSLEEIQNMEKFPYFSIMIIRPN